MECYVLESRRAMRRWRRGLKASGKSGNWIMGELREENHTAGSGDGRTRKEALWGEKENVSTRRMKGRNQ